MGKTDPHHQGETGLLLYGGGGIRNPGLLYGLSASMLNIKSSGKLQQPKNRTIKHSEPSGIKVWVTPSGIEARVTEGLAEGSSMEQGAGEGNHRYQLHPRDQTQGLQ